MTTLKETLSKCSIKQLKQLHKIINSEKASDYTTEESQKSPERIQVWNKLIRKEILRKQGKRNNRKYKNFVLSKSKVQRII